MRIATTLTERPVGPAMLRGFRCRCPQCGEGRLFSSFLKPVMTCASCGESFEGQRADDLPPYVTIMIVGHVIVPAVLAAEMSASPWPLWLHFVVWLPLTLVMTLALMQPVKGAIVAMQWAMRLHGFDPKGDIHDAPMMAQSAQKTPFETKP
jgi:uncharacterized protein (DUF983 family)